MNPQLGVDGAAFLSWVRISHPSSFFFNGLRSRLVRLRFEPRRAHGGAVPLTHDEYHWLVATHLKPAVQHGVSFITESPAPAHCALSKAHLGCSTHLRVRTGGGCIETKLCEHRDAQRGVEIEVWTVREVGRSGAGFDEMGLLCEAWSGPGRDIRR